MTSETKLFYKALLFLPWALLKRLVLGIDWVLARPKQKQLERPKGQTGDQIPYYSVVCDNWRIGLGIALPFATVLLWLNLLVQADDTVSKVIYGLCTIIWAPAIYDNFKTMAAMMFGESVLIGDIGDLNTVPIRDADQSALKLAYSMAEAAKARRVGMTLVAREGILRAYFRSDEDAVLIRASA